MQNGGRYVIEAEVKPPGRMHLAETAAVDCAGNALPSYAGTFIFLLPANVSSIFHINIKFKSVAGNELLYEVQTCVLTHYAPNHLFDYWDGHSLPVVDLPFAKKQLVGKFSVVLHTRLHTCLDDNAILVHVHLGAT